MLRDLGPEAERCSGDLALGGKGELLVLHSALLEVVNQSSRAARAPGAAERATRRINSLGFEAHLKQFVTLMDALLLGLQIVATLCIIFLAYGSADKWLAGIEELGNLLWFLGSICLIMLGVKIGSGFMAGIMVALGIIAALVPGWLITARGLVEALVALIRLTGALILFTVLMFIIWFNYWVPHWIHA